MNQLEAAWQSVEKHCSIARKAQIQPLRHFLRMQRNPHARLLAGQPGTTLCNKESALELESLVVKQFQSCKISKLEAVNWFGLIHAVIRRLDPKGTDIPQTRLADALPPADSPFRSSAIIAAECASFWCDALHRWIYNSATAPESEWQAAIVLSAVLHGGLIDSRKVELLIERLHAHAPPDQTNGYTSYTFLMPFLGVGNHHMQRWVLDPISDMLIHRYLAKKSAKSQDKPASAIAALLEKHAFCKIKLPSNISDLVAGSKAWWSLRIPQIDIQGASRAIQSHALRTNCWSRLTNSSEISRSTKKRPKEASEEGNSQNLDIKNKTGLENDQQWLAELHVIYPFLTEIETILNQKDRNSALIECLKFLSCYESNCLETTYLSFMRFLLEGNSVSRHDIAFSNIQNRCRVAIPRLLASIGEDNPANLSTPILEDHYSELVSNPDPALPINELRYGIREFHFYLVKQHKKKHMKDEGEIIGEDGTHKYVDARVISYDEYEVLCAWLDDQEHAQGWPKSQVIASRILLTLGFKAGLRRMEILGLRLCDLHPDVEFFAIVRRHSARRLKSNNSKRLLPLSILLSDEEQKLIKTWINLRLNQEERANSTSASPYLFPEFARRGTHAWVKQICRGVINGLQEITGDTTLHIHHLRHSFATWTYLRLRASDHPRLIRYFDADSATWRMLSSGLRFRVRLLGSAHSTTRKFSYAVARLLGHASPEVSFGSYIHACDMLLGDQVWQTCEDIDRSILIAASSLHKSQGYSHLTQDLENLVSASRSHDFPKDSALGKAPESETSNTTKSTQWIPFKTARGVINLVLEGSNEDDIGKKLGISPAMVLQMIEKAVQYGSKLGISSGIQKKTEPGRLIAKPKIPPRGQQTSRMLALEKRLVEVLATDAGLFHDGVTIHMENLDRRWLDVAFHSENERAKLLRYLAFFKALELPTDYFSWTNRSKEHLFLPEWCSSLSEELDWSPKRITQIAPSNTADSFLTWAGIRMESENSRSHGNVFATAIFLAIVGNL